MSSPLDNRMRTIAHEVLAEQAGPTPAADGRLNELEQTVAALGSRLDELEKAVTTPAPPVRRATRKESGDKHPE